MSFIDELKWRGLLHQTAGDGLDEHLSSTPRVAYCGFDPTADSLTIGNFLAIKMLMQWQRSGHQPIILMGGGTGMIGDPSGKDSERTLQSEEQVEHNIQRQRLIFERLLDFDKSRANHAILVNNMDWLRKMSFIDALRDIGKHFSVNQMMQRDSVKDRLLNREQGISYTEFSYVLLQAYDFLHLHQAHQCTLQLAGSDQYGNIVSGMDLIRRRFGNHENGHSRAFAITNKLVTKADGTKIGKSVGNTIWLSQDRTSAYKFYQFWLNSEDADVVKFLYWFSFMEQEQISELTQLHEAAPHARDAHRALAEHMTTLVHGEAATQSARAASQVLFGSGDLRELDENTLAEVFEGAPSHDFNHAELNTDNSGLVNVLVSSGLASSNRQAREFIGNGAVTINGEKVQEERKLNAQDLLHGHTILLKRGKKNWCATRWQ